MFTHLWQGLRTSLHDRNRRRQARLSLESLEERCLLSSDVVLQWNQAVLAAIRADKPTIGFVTRDLAIIHSAIYDAVNAIDHTSGVFHVAVDAPSDADPVAAADAAGLFTAQDRRHRRGALRCRTNSDLTGHRRRQRLRALYAGDQPG